MGRVLSVPGLQAPVGLDAASIARHGDGARRPGMAGPRANRLPLHGRPGFGGPHGALLLLGHSVGRGGRQSRSSRLPSISCRRGGRHCSPDGCAARSRRRSGLARNGAGGRHGLRLGLHDDPSAGLHLRRRRPRERPQRAGAELIEPASRRSRGCADGRSDHRHTGCGGSVSRGKRQLRCGRSGAICGSRRRKSCRDRAPTPFCAAWSGTCG